MISRNPWDSLNSDKKNANAQKNMGNQEQTNSNSKSAKKSGQKGRTNEKNGGSSSGNSLKNENSSQTKNYDAPWMWESWTAQPEPEWEEVSNKKKGGKYSDSLNEVEDFDRNPVGDVEVEPSSNPILSRAQKKNLKKKLKRAQNNTSESLEKEEESEENFNSNSSLQPSVPSKETTNNPTTPLKSTTESPASSTQFSLRNSNSSETSNKEDEFVDPKNVVKKTDANNNKPISASNSFSLLDQQFPSLPRTSAPPPTSSSANNTPQKKAPPPSNIVEPLPPKNLNQQPETPKVEENKNLSNGLSEEQIRKNREEEMRILRELEEKKRRIEELKRLEEMQRYQPPPQQQPQPTEDNQYQYHPFFHNNPMPNLHSQQQQYFPFDSSPSMQQQQQHQKQIEYQRQMLQSHQQQPSPYYSHNQMDSLEDSMNNFGIAPRHNAPSYDSYSSFQSEQDYINSLIGINELTSGAPGLGGNSPRRNVVPPGFGNGGNSGMDSGFLHRSMPPPGLDSNAGRGRAPPGFGANLRTSGGAPGFSSPARGNSYNPNHVNTYNNNMDPFAFGADKRDSGSSYVIPARRAADL